MAEGSQKESYDRSYSAISQPAANYVMRKRNFAGIKAGQQKPAQVSPRLAALEPDGLTLEAAVPEAA